MPNVAKEDGVYYGNIWPLNWQSDSHIQQSHVIILGGGGGGGGVES